MHDPRLGRFFAVDPIARNYPFLTPYQFSSNRTIDSYELEGLEAQKLRDEYSVDPALSHDMFWGAWEGVNNMLRTVFEVLTPDEVDGIVIRKVLVKNGLTVHPSISDETLGANFQLRERGWGSTKGVSVDVEVQEGLVDRVLSFSMDALNVFSIVPSFSANKNLSTPILAVKTGPITNKTVGQVLIKVAQKAQKLGRPADSKILGDNLEIVGVSRPNNNAAHHIVAGSDKRAAEAREILSRNNIDINEANNGVFLPQNSSVANPPAATHSTLHTDEYYRKITDRLKNTNDIRNELKSIGNELKNGEF